MIAEALKAFLIMGAGIALIVAGGNGAKCHDTVARDDRLYWGAMSWTLIVGGVCLFLSGLIDGINLLP